MTIFSREDSQFLTYLRSLSILVIVFGHIGLFWVFKPYSEFLHVFMPIFFFISGAVSYGSYCRSGNLFKYYKKRFVSLLVPYYLLVFVQFSVFIWANMGVSNLSFSDLLRWIFIIPNNAIMPFSIGHVWFLHTLFILVLVSPFYFHLFRLNKKYTILIIFFAIIMSFVQMFVDVSDKMVFFHNNLFKPLVHSCFFLFGVLVFHAKCCTRNKDLILLLLGSIGISVALVKHLQINIDYDFHTYAPDLFYVSGSFAAIAVMLLCKHLLIKLISSFTLEKLFSFLHRHTYSIYLIHVPVLSLWFYLFAQSGAEVKSLKYGLLKMLFVLVGTVIPSVPFTYVSSYVVEKAFFFLGKERSKPKGHL